MQALWWWSKTETRRSDTYVCFNVNFNVFFKLIKVHLLVSELYIYQNARCNDKEKKTLYVSNSVIWKVSGGSTVGILKYYIVTVLLWQIIVDRNFISIIYWLLLAGCSNSVIVLLFVEMKLVTFVVWDALKGSFYLWPI